MRDDRERLLDIQEAIGNIEKYAAQGREVFEQDELIQTWIIHHLEIIGEACRALSSEFMKKHSEVPWTDIIAMRNILVHQYFGIDKKAVWSVIQQNLPDLKRHIEEMLRGM